jgi:hypothetical protein
MGDARDGRPVAAFNTAPGTSSGVEASEAGAITGLVEVPTKRYTTTAGALLAEVDE